MRWLCVVLVLLVGDVAGNWLICIGCWRWLVLVVCVVVLLVSVVVVIWLMYVGCCCWLSLVVCVVCVGWLLVLLIG